MKPDFSENTSANNLTVTIDRPINDECEQILFEDSRLKYFFEVSLTAALEKEEPVGHILLVCPDIKIAECFTELLSRKMEESGVRGVTLSSDIQPGDLAAILTNLYDNDLLVTKNKTLELSPSCIEVLKPALSNYFMDVMVGKGPSAKSIRLDIPRFTFVVCVEKTSPVISALLPCFEYVLKIEMQGLQKLCIAKIRSEANMEISKEAAAFVANKARNDIPTAISYLNRVQEYAKIKHICCIEKAFVEEVVDLAGLGVDLNRPEDSEDLPAMIRDIRDSLRSIQMELSDIRREEILRGERIEEIKSILQIAHGIFET